MARPRSDIAPRIVRAARTCFLAEGVDGTSLRTIARAAHTNIGMIYYYFPTKDDLFLAVVEEPYIRVVEEMARALDPALPVPERLRRLYARLGHLSDEEIETLKLVAREALVSSARLDRLLERFLRGHVPLVVATLADGMRDGSIDPTRPPGLVIAATLGMAVASQFLRAARGRGMPIGEVPDGEALAAQLVELLFGGIAPRR
jgi:AcrR family transcriptional regulator